jgi:hypothetical protein
MWLFGLSRAPDGIGADMDRIAQRQADRSRQRLDRGEWAERGEITLGAAAALDHAQCRHRNDANDLRSRRS